MINVVVVLRLFVHCYGMTMACAYKSLHEAKEEFSKIMRSLAPPNHVIFLQWIAKTWDIDEVMHKEENELADIATILRARVPFDGVLPSESLCEPTDATLEERESTVSIDEFLYDDNHMDELVEAGKVSLYKCSSCGSKNVRPLTLISHSCSIDRLKCIFQEMCPSLTGKTFLDVGSRLGAVVYGAVLLSTAHKIIGIEMNKEFCKLTKEILTERNMLDNVDIIHDNVLNQADVVAQADVVFINNAFAYFTSDPVAKQCWKFLQRSIKPGAFLITCPKVGTNLSDMLGEPWCNWLTLESTNDEYDMGMYSVLQTPVA